MMLSAVIPNWNGASYLARCLAATIQSAHASGLEWEIIVIDDASADSSPDIVEKDFPSVKLLRNAVNQGFGKSVNQGAACARGDILVFLNTIWCPKNPCWGNLRRRCLKTTDCLESARKHSIGRDRKPTT